MECAQIEVTGGTGTAKPQTYSIPGIYKVLSMMFIDSFKAVLLQL
jgi:hypothetical protein